ncbi:MAG: hypothetical protein H6Q58_53 [Firmicutes bacterium]|nr:hypothetical protein [Bacillota bacterium]
MANIFDYLEWRGDLSFAQDRFNEVDNLILSVLAYVDYEGLVSETAGGPGTPLSKAADYYKTHEFKSPAFYDNPFFNEIPSLLQKAAESARFGSVELSGYVNQIDHENSKQFSALVFAISTGLQYIAFRGTDDTIAGWKEDFEMSFMEEVPAQKQAAEYLAAAAPQLEGRFFLGGHSKGGNLAVYAATHCSAVIRDRIEGVFNNDGPGFRTDVIQSEVYQSLLDRINTYVPKSSVVGILMEHGEEYKVVGSSGIGIMQHNALNWEVKGPSFVYENELTRNSRNLDRALRSLMSNLSIENKSYFVDAFFEIIQATGAHTLSELTREKLNSIDTMVKTYKNMDPSQQEMLKGTIETYIRERQKVFRKNIGEGIDALLSRKNDDKIK